MPFHFLTPLFTIIFFHMPLLDAAHWDDDAAAEHTLLNGHAAAR